MGYYTKFSITIKSRITRAAEMICDKLNKITGYEQFSVCGNDIPLMEVQNSWELESYDELKWYDWEEDMTVLAKQFDEVEFYIEGKGEDAEDWWIALFKGDKKQIRYCSPPIGYWEE